ncbi:MAG: hypothetical protein ACPGUV_15460 [Polyangiales bacterium]
MHDYTPSQLLMRDLHRLYGSDAKVSERTGIAQGSVLRLRKRQQRNLQGRFRQQVADRMGIEGTYFDQEGDIQSWTAFRKPDVPDALTQLPVVPDSDSATLWLRAQLSWLTELSEATLDPQLAQVLGLQAISRVMRSLAPEVFAQLVEDHAPVDRVAFCAFLHTLHRVVEREENDGRR